MRQAHQRKRPSAGRRKLSLAAVDGARPPVGDAQTPARPSQCGAGFCLVDAAHPSLPSAPAPGPSWRALRGVRGQGFALIELEHESGERAEWLFDGEGRQSSAPGAWPADARAALARAFTPALQALRDTCLCSAPSPAPACLRDFASLGPRLRLLIAEAAQAEVLPDPAHIDLDQHGAGQQGAGALSWPALRQSLAAGLQQRLTEALRHGAMTWPSPMTGAAMTCTGGFSLDDFNTLYRFREPATGRDLFILATEHLARVAGLYDPARGEVVTFGPDQSRILRQHFPRLGHHLLRHLAVMADSLLRGQRVLGGHHRLAAYLRGGGSAHLGHQLWNELTAIDELAAGLPAHRLPQWLIPGERTEFYGPIDALYPALSGRVRRGFADHAALTRHAYENRLTLIRPARERVGAGLRRRVMARASAYAPPPPLPPPPGALFMLGLRVENRTATDLTSLCSIFIEEAARHSPGCTVILDGHNACGDERGDVTIGSYRQDEAAEHPLAVERALADALRARFAEADVSIVDTLGEPLATSLAWAGACRAVFALWGAGLAKYRWVANTPGLVVSNRWNLEQKGDLHIYDAAEFMAEPSPLTFIAAEAVEDCPDAPMLVPFDQPTYSNFKFDPAAMRREVSLFLAAAGCQAPMA